MPHRDFDVVLYGASGFTGRQTVEYFAAHAPDGLRWAIAGRDRARLEAAKAAAGKGAAGAAVLVADSRDAAALDAIASRARVVLSTAGPFALHGDAIVEACVRHRTHYADISGETPWIRGLIDRHHARAAADGTRIVPCSGFDSVPSDLGAWLAARELRRAFGLPCREVKAFFAMRGGFNGGTLASGLNLRDSGLHGQTGDPFLLDPLRDASPEEAARNADPAGVRWDEDANAWTAPYFMGPINTRVVRRSWALLREWGESPDPRFNYREYLKFDGPLGWLAAGGVTAGGAAFDALLGFGPTRDLLRAVLPQPGTGPSAKSIEEGWFRAEFLAVAADGRRAHARVADRGDPSNRVTVKCLCETALGLALDPGTLPGGPSRGGILTPVTALGDVLLGRLRAAGMTLEAAAD